MILLTLAGRFIAWLAGAHTWTPHSSYGYATRMYIVPTTSWLWRWFFSRYNMAAFTWGATIVRREDLADDFIQVLLRHEAVHVLQAGMYGVLFPLVYVWESIKARVKGGAAYHDNRFEVEARAIEARMTSLEATRATTADVFKGLIRKAKGE